MLGKIKERCFYCGGDVYYHSGEQLTKCEWCGHTLVTTKFENELERMNAALEEGEAAKHALENAEKERDSARLRLEKAMGALEGIHGSQRNVDKALTRIASDFSNNKDNQREMKNLLIAIKGQVNSGEDTLSKILAMISSSQQNGEAKLADLSHLADGILKNQDNMLTALTLLPPLTEKLDLNAQQQNQLVSDFMNWFQDIRQSDVKRLKSIAVSSDHLLKAQTALEKKMDSLQKTAKDTQTMVEGFNKEYNRDKLEKLQTLFRQAENAQLDQDFDVAAERYLEVEAAGGEDVETCWRRIICHYCIYYQKDVKKRISVPIILNPDLRDPREMSLRREMEKKLLTEKEEVRKIYHDSLAEIDKILESYRHARLETDYDVFISVKQNDDTGRYTSDSDKASDLYDFLTRRGYNVFNSRRSLRANEIYEPRIIAALMSSKVMIVVGSSPENMNSDWVKNEWSRFTWLQRRENGSKKQILCYLTGNMDPYTIPKGLNPDKQAIIDGINAHEELLTAIAFLKKTGIQAGGSGFIPTPLPKQDYGKIRNQMTLWLVRGKYDKVLEKYEQLNEEGLFLTSLSLHMTALCANSRVADIMQIINSDFILEDAPEYKAAVLLCDDEKEKQTLEGYLAQNREWRNKQNNKPITPNSKEIEKEREADPGQKAVKKGYNFQESETNIIRFGKYVQKKNGSPEPIEWQVLERKNGRMLVISKYALDCQPYNTIRASVTWETCSLRKWLNETFVNNAFNADEQKMIVSSEVTADKNPSDRTPPGNNTRDKVFLLSITEVNKYFNSDKARECQVTAYCYAQGAYKAGNNCCWWLRSPGLSSHCANFVYNDGAVLNYGFNVDNVMPAVRPALWIDLES